MPYGFRGMWLALTLALSSYMGVEVLAVTAGEARRPEEAIPRAMRTMVFRLILFYVLAISVMVTMTPWNQTGDGSLLGSAFVRAFGSIGIPYAASIMNMVIITAALSSANTNLYLSTRMLFSLARGNLAPALLGRLSSNGVPHRALAASSLGMVAAILLAIYVPQRAFLLMYGSAVAGMYFVWVVILLAHLSFRRHIGARLKELPLRLRLFPASNILAVALILAIACSTFAVDGLRYSVPAFSVLLGTISLAYWKVKGRSSASAGTTLEASRAGSPQEL